MKEKYRQKTDFRSYWHFIRMTLPVYCLYLFLTACTDDKNECKIQQPQRTILFYIAGDNNLTYEVPGKIEQLMATPIPAGCSVLVFQDTRESNPQLIEIVRGSNGKNTTTIARNYEECNTADTTVFRTVLREIESLYPSRSYGLVFFSHASGWMPEQTYSQPGLRSIGMDGQSEMELSGFADAIPEEMFDFIIFEACHMAGIEVAWELKDKTDYIIASSAEIVSPGFAPIYPKALSYLSERETDLKKFMELVANDYRIRQGDYGSFTLSLINTDQLEKIADAIKECMCPLYPDESIQRFDRNGKDLFFDFYDSFSHSMAAEQLNKLQQAIGQCVIYKLSSDHFMPSYGGFEITSHSGLTTYIPQEKYPKLNESYKRLKWYKEVSENRKIYDNRKELSICNSRKPTDRTTVTEKDT